MWKLRLRKGENLPKVITECWSQMRLFEFRTCFLKHHSVALKEKD